MNETTNPLQWPLNWPRCKSPTCSRFGNGKKKLTITKALDALEFEMKAIRATALTVSTNLRTRLDGRPLGRQAGPVDNGVAIYFTLKTRRLALACDKWTKVEENIWALAKHVEALRGQERWGVGTVEQAFAGYMALPEKGNMDFWAVLGVSNPLMIDENILGQIYRDLSQVRHPDRGGTAQAFQELTAARDEALKYIRNRK